MIRRTLTVVCCLLSLCYVTAGAAPLAISQISYDMSKVLVSLSSGDLHYIDSDANTHSWLHVDDGSYIHAPEMQGDGEVTAVIPGTDASASAFVANGSVTVNSNATTQYGDAYVSAGTTSDLGLYVESAEVITITLDISLEISASAESLNEASLGLADDYLALYVRNDDGSLNPSPLIDTYTSYWLSVVDGESALPLNIPERLTLTFDLRDIQGAPFTGRLLLQNSAQTIADAQNWNEPADVPEPTSLSLLVMGLAMLLPLALRRKV